MTVLLTADIHLSENPREDYRWGLLPWLAEQAKVLGAKEVIIAGDLTEGKDRHPSQLVNRFAQQLYDLAQVVPVYILRGNHDYVAEDSPFFGFTSRLRGTIWFLLKPTYFNLSIGSSLFLPNTTNFEKAWQEARTLRHNGESLPPRFVFCHQTFTGSKAENGMELPGISTSIFRDFKGQVWAGDIHVPQRITKNLFHIGAPYRVHFGDTYTPRVVLLRSDGEYSNLHFPCPRKHCLDLSTPLQNHRQEISLIGKGDLVKIRVQLSRKEYPEWQKVRSEILALAEHRGWVVCGIQLMPIPVVRNTVSNPGTRMDPKALVSDYVKKQRVDAAHTTLGHEILEEVL